MNSITSKLPTSLRLYNVQANLFIFKKSPRVELCPCESQYIKRITFGLGCSEMPPPPQSEITGWVIF